MAWHIIARGAMVKFSRSEPSRKGSALAGCSGGALLLSLLCSSASAAVQFQGFTEAANSGNVTSVTLATPAGTSPGDLLIAAVATDGTTASTLAPALAGWNVLDTGTGGAAVTLGVFWKLAGASEPATHDFTWVGGEEVYAWMMRFTGYDPAGPINGFTTFTGTSANPTSPSVVSTVADALILRLGAFDDENVTTDVTGLTGHTTITMDASGFGSGTTSGGAGYVLQPVAGPSGTNAFALTALRAYRTLTVAIAPAFPAASSAVAEIDPSSIAKASTSNAFRYNIDLAIGGTDTGVDAVSIMVPPSFGNPFVSAVEVGGAPVPFTDNTSGHLIRVSLSTKLTGPSRIQIDFIADAPSCPSTLGEAFRSTVDDSGTLVPAQDTTEGDGDGDPLDNNSWKVVTTGPPCWYPDAGYQYRKQLCLDGTQIAGTLSDFPVLVSLSDADLGKALASGYDLLFTDEDGVTRLDHERETWDRASGSLLTWVRFPQLVPGIDKTFFVYYGKPTENVDQENPPAVWDAGYKAVWHLEQTGNGSLDEFLDSTGNANHGQGGAGAANNTPVPTAGVVANAQGFDGAGDFIAIPKVEDDFDVDLGTVSAWFTVEPSGSRVIVELRTDNNNHLSLWWNGSTRTFRLLRRATGVEVLAETAAVTDDGAWHLATLTWDKLADELKGYIDGAQIGTTQTGLLNWIGALNGLGSIGVQPTMGRPFPHKGKIDEVRISDVVHSPAWIQTSFNNQSNPTSFLKCVGAEEPLATSGATLSSAADQTFTVGFPPSLAATITVTDTTGGSITAANDIRIHIPAGFPMRWNDQVVSVGPTGSAAAKVDSNVKAYEDSGRTVVLDVVTDFGPGDQVLIDGLEFWSFTSPSPPDNLELEIANDGVLSAFDDKRIDIVPDTGPTLSSETDQVFTVLQPSTPAAKMYVTEGQTPFINPTNGIIIRIPATFPMVWDNTVSTVILGGNAAAKVSSSIAYEVGNRGVILTVTSPFAPGDFVSISGLRFTGFSAVQAPDNLGLAVGAANDLDDKTIEIQELTDVPFFTATATDLKVELEWVSPPFGTCAAVVVVRRLGAPPTPVVGDWFDVIPCPGLPGTKQSTIDSPPSNDVTYQYGIFVHDGAGGYSKGKFLEARPFDSNPGPVKWAYSTGASSMAPPGLRFFGGSAIAYVVSNDKIVHSVLGGPTGGTWPLSWTPHLLGGPAQARPPVVSFTVGTATNGAVFVGSQDGAIYTINAENGSETWSRSISTMVQAAPAGNFVFYDATAKDILLTGTRDSSGPNSLVALKVADGTPAWSFTNSTGQAGDGKTIGIISGTGFVDYASRRFFFASRKKSGGSPNTLWCVDFGSGSPSLVWAKDIGNVDGSPIIYRGVLYVGNNAGELYAVDPATGSFHWSLPLGDGPIKGFVFPRFGTNDVLVSTTGRIWSITDNGGSAAVRAGWPVTSIPSPSTPLNIPGTNAVLVGSSDGKVYRLDAATGSTVSSTTLGDGSSAVGMPTVDLLNLMFYVGTDQGVIYGVELQ